MKLLETYAKRLAVSESVYAKANGGEKMSNARKICTATMLNNVNKYMTEAFSNSVGTQRADLGAWKKFCLNLTTVVMPNLIAHDLVLVHPMTSISGYITYLQYTYGSNKGGIEQGQPIADPFGIAKRDERNMQYTAQAVVEEVELDGEGMATLSWHPIFAASGKGLATVDERTPVVVGGDSGVTVEVIDAAAGKIKVTGATGKVKIKYMYNNVIIPQDDLPIVNVEMKQIPLVAKFRRIAIYYSSIAAFQAKQDYGFDLGDQLAEKAVAELNYEIDEEIVKFLVDMAGSTPVVTFNATERTGVSLRDHYAAFAKTVEEAKVEIYKRTMKFYPTYMLCAADILPILSMVEGFKASSTAGVAGPFLAGTFNGLKVFVSPSIAQGKFILGVNGNDMMTSAAVYAPYMPVLPTQLLNFADHGNSQGFATGYALEKLNDRLVVLGAVTHDPQPVLIKQ